MKLSISNIAWPKEDNKRILKLIASFGFSAIEIAPSRIWPDFRMVSKGKRLEELKVIQEYGLSVCSMHSLFWGIKNASLFGTVEEQDRLKSYFKELIVLADDIQVPRMVFGSPGVRRRGDLDDEVAFEIAAEVLRDISQYAYDQGVKILIEPLSADETDFIRDHKEGIKLVEYVDSKGFGLHLDAKAMCSEKIPINEILQGCRSKVEHFHANEKKLGSFKNVRIPHADLAEGLNGIGYGGYVSIEMKQFENYEEEISAALDYVREVYM